MGQRTTVQTCVKIRDFLSLSPPSTQWLHHLRHCTVVQLGSQPWNEEIVDDYQGRLFAETFCAIEDRQCEDEKYSGYSDSGVSRFYRTTKSCLQLLL